LTLTFSSRLGAAYVFVLGGPFVALGYTGPAIITVIVLADP